MEIEELIAMVKALYASSLPENIIWMIFVLQAIIKPLYKRLNGMSAYIKKFLALQRRRARGIEALTQSIKEMILFQKSQARKVRASDIARTMPTE